ncbi:hypothetical protein POM88_016228 [Heracleum sosnowskyi]|uniref:RNA polymerase-associated protein LEO1 n=1 Tax=Heracleum sosnowskyi TaxID=360622 RepID=A0AAD8MSQ7_9APIA|nr:hypothetical protein POM88_016228 [Heracleum sosnowskyi]
MTFKKWGEHQIDHDSNRSPVAEEGSYEKGLRPEDMLADEEEIPLRPPPACPEKMNMIKTYVEEDEFETDESGSKKRIRLENNIVRWRNVKNPDGTVTRESNARFIGWSDGSLQLQIGNEVLDISVQDVQHDEAHLFLKHEKGILQSQGRLVQKMRETLTLRETRKEQKERAESQTIRANELLNRNKEKVNRKYTQTVRREHQLSPGFLEEDEEPDYYESRHPAPRRRFDDDMEMEARAEKRIINANKGHKEHYEEEAAADEASQEEEMLASSFG